MTALAIIAETVTVDTTGIFGMTENVARPLIDNILTLKDTLYTFYVYCCYFKRYCEKL